jgi:hypothetical protein
MPARRHAPPAYNTHAKHHSFRIPLPINNKDLRRSGGAVGAVGKRAPRSPAARCALVQGPDGQPPPGRSCSAPRARGCPPARRRPQPPGASLRVGASAFTSTSTSAHRRSHPHGATPSAHRRVGVHIHLDVDPSAFTSTWRDAVGPSAFTATRRTSDRRRPQHPAHVGPSAPAATWRSVGPPSPTATRRTSARRRSPPLLTPPPHLRAPGPPAPAYFARARQRLVAGAPTRTDQC